MDILIVTATAALGALFSSVLTLLKARQSLKQTKRPESHVEIEAGKDADVEELVRIIKLAAEKKATSITITIKTESGEEIVFTERKARPDEVLKSPTEKDISPSPTEKNISPDVQADPKSSKPTP